jgi:hypothetical protein
VTRKVPVDLVASVRGRLSNVAQEQGHDLQLIFTRYGIERMLYRMSHVPSAKRFVLKGAVLFYLWDGDASRPTQDVDFLASGDASPEAIAKIFRDVCRAAVEPDGLTFLAPSVRAVTIRGRQEYGGVRVKLMAMLGNVRIPLQIDVGFGDAVTPRAKLATFPTLLDFPAPRVKAYPAETVVAEKLEAMVTLGIANTRMKDFYDAEKRTQWKAFLGRGRLGDGAAELPGTIERIAQFALPPLQAVARNQVFVQRWDRKRGWKSA